MRKKIARVEICLVLAVFILLVVGINVAFSKKPEQKKSSIISVEPLEFLIPALNITYEKILRPDLTAEGKIALSFKKEADWEYAIIELKGYIKKYTNSTAPFGFWYGGGIGILPTFVQFSYFDWSEWKTKTEKGMGIFFSLSGNAGYKLPVGENFSLELGIGIGISGGNLTIAGENLPLTTLSWDGRFSLGYAF